MANTDEISKALDELAVELEPAIAPAVSSGRRRRLVSNAAAQGAAIMQVVERDGVLHIEEAESAEGVRRRRRGKGPVAGEEIKYEREFQRLDRSQIGTWLEALDNKLTPYRGLRVLGDKGLESLASVPPDGRILLLVHGTFSESESFINSFGQNPRGSDFIDWARGHYSHIITFDHPTLAVSPVLNARTLALLFGESAADIDVISHSRGGLVTRWWLEVFDRAPPEKRRAIFVGSPLAGTGLAAPANIRGSLSLLSNVATALGVASAGIPFLTVLTGVFRVVTSVTSFAAKTPAVDAAVALVPGLAAQSRVGNNRELISLRQSSRPAAGRYFAIKSNFECEKAGWKFWKYFRNIGDRAKDSVSDLVFEGQNDLVVDTGSMVDLADGLVIPTEQVLDFGTTEYVHHTNYFAQPRTLAFIEEMLSEGPRHGVIVAQDVRTVEGMVPGVIVRGDGVLAGRIGEGAKHIGVLAGRIGEGAKDIVMGAKLEKTESGSRKPPDESGQRTRRRGVRDQQQQGQQQMALPPGPAVLRRTPHLDFDQQDAVAPGTKIRVRVYADKKAARSDEASEDIVIELPEDIRSIDLNTHLLVSPQLEVMGPAVKPLTIDVDSDTSSDVTFEVRVRDRNEIVALVRELPSVARASISSVFNYRHRPSGSVTRIVSLDLDFEVPDLPNVKERAAAGTLRIETEAKAADLLVQVRAQPINDGRQFQCWVSTPLIEAEEEEHWEDWNLPAVAESIVRGYMANFVDEDATDLERLTSLKGAGRQLFDAAPDNFKRVYWQLIDAGRPPKTIAVVSDEPYIPWELMIPHRRGRGRSETRNPLGVDCAVGRWLFGDGCSGPQRLPLSDSIVIAPRYKGRNALPHAEAEASYVLDHFPGVRIEPAMLETIDAVFSSHSGSILHLVCHGVDAAESAVQAVYLEGNRKLDTTMLSGLDSLRNGLEEKLTLVVINACEVGRPKLALVGPGGFAQTFIDLGAAGVVAALWSVRDDLAHEVAMNFYQSVLKDPARPFAEILRDVRARASDKQKGVEDTYAAYCFYGDPLACAAP